MLRKLNKEGDMLRRPRFMIGMILLVIVSFALGGCGSGKKEGAVQSTSIDLANAALLGNANCLQCHNAGKDLTMLDDERTIGEVYEDSLHFGHVQCENCHGGGEFHWGTGPLENPVPDWHVCVTCHKPPHGDFPTEFPETAHANTNQRPDKFFFQGSASGQEQATDHGTPEFTPDGTPVTKAQHIEECSMCHDENQRFVYGPDQTGDLLKPDPKNMPEPTVSCANCHDAHQVAKEVGVATRTSEVRYPIFRKSQIAGVGPWNRPIIYQPNGAVQSDGSVDLSKVVGPNNTNTNELTVELVCAACHTKGKYKYSEQPTHQTDVYTQWTMSAHGDRNEPPFAEFSAYPPAYTNPTTGLPYSAGGHQSLWPYDMSLGSTTGGSGSVGLTANTTQNAGIPGSRGPNDNFPCYKCHNGITSTVYQDDQQGTSAAPVVFGDEPVTCITCHYPHQSPYFGQDGGPGPEGLNLRKPVVMTKYTSDLVTFAGNVFLDDTPVPDATGKATVCVFCHQGRESGYTLFKERLASDDTLSGSFFNPHYLGTGAMLWARNGYEYAGKMYGMVTPHQDTNCYGCHMATGVIPEVGGHTWKIVSDDDAVVNSATCNASACHDDRVPSTNSDGQFDNFRDTVFDPTNDYDGNGQIQGIAVEVAGLENSVIALLQANGIYYDDTSYPYFFSDDEHTSSFTSWTLPTLKAAFNLSFVIKGLPSGESQIGEPNTSAATHNYKYNIELLHDSYEDLYNYMTANSISIPSGSPLPGNMARPEGSRPATNYDPQGGGAYNPRQ